MSEESSGCGCCPECTGGPDCECGCPDCTCDEYYYESCCCDDHDHDCCEGSGFVLSAVSSIVGMIFLGILALLYSMAYMNDVWGFPSVVAADMSFLLFCIGGILAFIGVIAFKAGDVTEGILFAFAGISALIANGALIFGFASVAYLDWIVLIIILMVAVILFLGGDTTFGLAVLLIALGSLFAAAFGSTDLGPIAACIAYLAAGVMLLYVAISDWLFVETGVDLPIL